jgi:hypothetical protein
LQIHKLKPPGSAATSCLVAEGESQQGVAVIEINVKNGTVRLSNVDWEQTLALER